MGTKTAEEMWQSRLAFAILFYEKLLDQLACSRSVTGCVILNADTRPCILLDGQTAFISGGALLSNDLENGHARTIMNLPEKYRPGRTQYRVSCVSSGLLLFEIGHTGEVILTNLTGATVLNETYIPFSISYAI